MIVPFSTLPPGLEPVEGIMDTDASGTTQELLFTGRAECVPDSVQRLVKPNLLTNHFLSLNYAPL